MDAIRLGRSLRALRRERGWRQRDVADRAGLSKSTVGRLEAGQLDGVTVGSLRRVAGALGTWLDIGVRWNGESLDRLLDAAHADLVERSVTLLRGAGWEAIPEASFAIGGERGSIDVLAVHPATALALVVEVKSVVPDLQGTLHGLDRKARLAPNVLRERGIRARGVARLLVLAETRTNRRRAEAHGATLAAALPSSGRATLSWIRDPCLPPMAGRLFLTVAHPAGRTGGGRHRVRVRAPDPSVDRAVRASLGAGGVASGPPGGSSSRSR